MLPQGLGPFNHLPHDIIGMPPFTLKAVGELLASSSPRFLTVHHCSGFRCFRVVGEPIGTVHVEQRSLIPAYAKDAADEGGDQVDRCREDPAEIGAEPTARYGS